MCMDVSWLTTDMSFNSKSESRLCEITSEQYKKLFGASEIPLLTILMSGRLNSATWRAFELKLLLKLIAMNEIQHSNAKFGRDSTLLKKKRANVSK